MNCFAIAETSYTCTVKKPFDSIGKCLWKLLIIPVFFLYSCFALERATKDPCTTNVQLLSHTTTTSKCSLKASVFLDASFFFELYKYSDDQWNTYDWKYQLELVYTLQTTGAGNFVYNQLCGIKLGTVDIIYKKHCIKHNDLQVHQGIR